MKIHLPISATARESTFYINILVKDMKTSQNTQRLHIKTGEKAAEKP